MAGFAYRFPDRMAKCRDVVYAHHKARGKALSDIELEMRCFQELPLGHDLKGEFCLSVAQMRWDFLYVESMGIENFWFTRIIRTLCTHKRVYMIGAACVAGETKILDPVTGSQPTIQELWERNEAPTVMTLDGHKKASVPFLKGVADLYEVRLSNGESFTCTLQHKILTHFGYREISQISVGDEVYTYSRNPPDSISEPAPSARGLNDLDFQRITEDSKDRCSAGSHPCDARLPSDQGICRSSSPSRDDVPVRTSCACGNADDPLKESRDNHLVKFGPHPSTLDTSPPSWMSEMDPQIHYALRTSKSLCLSPQWPYESRQDNTHLSPFSGPIPDSLHSEILRDSSSEDRIFCSSGLMVSLTQVSSIRKSHHGAFFDLTVPDVHHYFAEGGIHHNSAGKTFGAAVWGMNMWGASPWNTTFLVTSTDKESLDSKAWGAIRDLRDKDKLQIGVRVDYEDAIVLEGKAKQRDIRDAIKAIALPKGSEGQKAIGKVQGRKNRHVIWLRDEYDHMDGFVKDAEDNLMANPWYQSVSCSNKPQEGGPMWQEALPDPKTYPLGWEDPVLPTLDGWFTEDGAYVLYFDGEKSPNTLAPGDKEPFEMLTRKSYIESVRKKGEDSLGWWLYIKAFPKSGMAHDRLLTQKVLEWYEATSDPIWQGQLWTVVAGLDPSWSKGGDDCVADFGKVGMDYRGTKILAHEASTVTLNTKLTGSGTIESQIASVFLDECQKRDCHIVAIDISGSGGKVANAIRDEATKRGYKLEIITVDAAGSPDENERYQIGDDTKTGKELFDRRVSELWYSYRLDVEAGLIRGASKTTKATLQLCERRVRTDERKRFELEKKDVYKERNKGVSPDHAEARVLLRYAARKHGLGVTIPKEPVKVNLGGSHSELRKAAYSYGGQKKAAYQVR